MEGKIFAILDSFVDNKLLKGAVVHIQSEDKSIDLQLATGNLASHSRYFIASTTKLYTTAVLLRLRVDGAIDLDDPISTYLDSSWTEDLHEFRGKSFGASITVRQLMAQTSGLPDYFEGKGPGRPSVHMQVVHGRDLSWTYEEAIGWSKELTPKFAPGAGRKAFYSDTNYQLLGKIIENVSGRSLKNAYGDFIFHPMGLTSTYLYDDPEDRSPANMNFGSTVLHVPRAMSSFRSDGGIVSTAGESMEFLRAFFAGQLFPVEYLKEIQDWRRIFFPLQYGTGIARFKMPGFLTPFRTTSELVGHSGLSGAFAYKAPRHGLYLTGTVNQIQKPGTSYRMLIKMLNKIQVSR